jgi:hypothetical protein
MRVVLLMVLLVSCDTHTHTHTHTCTYPIGRRQSGSVNVSRCSSISDIRPPMKNSTKDVNHNMRLYVMLTSGAVVLFAIAIYFVFVKM